MSAVLSKNIRRLKPSPPGTWLGPLLELAPQERQRRVRVVAEENVSPAPLLGETFCDLSQATAQLSLMPSSLEEEPLSQPSRLWHVCNNEWVVKGIVDAKLLKHSLTGRVRCLMRVKTTKKFVSNFTVEEATLRRCQLIPVGSKGVCWQWWAFDSSDGYGLERLMFASTELASQFKVAFDEAKVLNRAASGVC